MRYFRDITSIKYRVIICMIITWITFIFNSKTLLETAPEGMKLSIFDLMSLPIGGGTLGIISLSFPIVPIFCFIVISILNVEDRSLIVLREVSRVKIWNVRVKFIAIFSFLYSLIIMLSSYLISGLVVKDFNNGWRDEGSLLYNLLVNNNSWEKVEKIIHSPMILGIVFLGLFLGILAIGMLISMLKVKLKNIYIYLIVIIILLSDAILGKFSIFLGQMIMTADNWMNLSSIVLNYAYLLFLAVIFYILGKEMTEKKDFFGE